MTLTSTSRINLLAVVSVVAALLAVAGMLGLGTTVLAVFAVGAGHVALHQIQERGDRGRAVALVGLVVGYCVGIWGLMLSLSYIPAVVSQF
jgi:hypothetical protein